MLVEQKPRLRLLHGFSLAQYSTLQWKSSANAATHRKRNSCHTSMQISEMTKAKVKSVVAANNGLNLLFHFHCEQVILSEIASDFCSSNANENEAS